MSGTHPVALQAGSTTFPAPIQAQIQGNVLLQSVASFWGELKVITQSAIVISNYLMEMAGIQITVFPLFLLFFF